MKKMLAALMVLFICGQAAGKNVKYPNVYCVILAGGSGKRLWPLSRAEKPKQFLSVCGEQTLLQEAVDRVSSSVAKEHIWIATTKQHEESVKNCVGDVIGRVIVEPGMRNTGPAILLNCFQVYRQDPEATIMFLPSDPFIPNHDRFVSFLERAIDFSSTHDRISLLGLRPTYPATGYGYIEYDDAVSPNKIPFTVKRFHEKPVYEVAQRYCEQGNMLWNISMFCAKARVFLDEFRKHAPDIYESVQAYVEGNGQYEDVRSESIDYAVMEKSERISVFPADFQWCDVGNVAVFLSLQKEFGVTQNNVMQINSTNNLVAVPNKLVALVGVNDLCVIETEDTILVAHKDQTEKVRQIVQQLGQSDMDEFI